MDSSNLNSLWRTLTKLRRLRSAPADSGGGGSVPFDDGDKIRELKFSGNLGMFSAKRVVENKQQQQQNMDSLLAKLFAGVSAVKAAYAELQVAQSPYDPESIQAADLAVVCELMRLSELKQSYLKGELADDESQDFQPALVVQIQEQRNLIKTYKITTRKLESDLQLREADVRALRSRLLECSVPSPDLHLSGMNPTHFLAVLRHTVKSVRSFSRQLTKMMELASWDLDAAANSVHPGVVLRSSAHRCFAFESYVSQMMFSDFQHRDFSLGSLEEMSRWNRRNFFEEFRAAKGEEEWLGRPLGKFCRVKYLLLLHPRMESAFFGDLEQRELVSSGRGFPGSELFMEFAEMARRVWLLHCLFFSFDEEAEASIFQVRRGCRFSEVFMESVAGEDDDDERPAVGFTVVPGFRMRGTVIQCKVYLSSS